MPARSANEPATLGDLGWALLGTSGGKRGAQSEWSHAGVEGLHHICFSCPQSLAPDCVPAGNPRLGPGGL